ncbi:MAG TPA: metal ABC transporter permease [bacterium]|nr:metal ABC transporter permease [bacterium]
MISLWQYAFVHNALIAGAITAIVAGCVAPFVTLRNQGFAVHGLAEVSFAGAAGAVFLKLPVELGVLGASFIAAVGFGSLGVRLRERDVAIGSVLAFSTGIGVLFLTLYRSYSTEAFSILFGSILAVGPDDVIRALVVGAIALGALAVIGRPLRFASIDPEVADARGVPVRLLSTLFLLVLALAVTVTVQVIGVLLVLTLLIAPAGTAQRLTLHPVRVTLYSVLIALGATLGGIVCAVYTSWPVSFFVPAFSLGAYLTARWLGPVQRDARTVRGETEDGAAGTAHSHAGSGS